MKRKIIALLTCVSALAVSAVTCFAAESAAVTAMSTGISGIKDDIVAGIGAVSPYALAVVGLFLLWRYGMKFFKAVSK